jgi:hypothetical protein
MWRAIELVINQLDVNQWSSRKLNEARARLLGDRKGQADLLA